MGQSGDMFFSLMPRWWAMCYLVHTTHFAHTFSNSSQTAAAVNTVAHHILWHKLKCHAKEVVLSIHYSHICSPLLVADISGAADCTCTLRARCSHLLHPTKGNAPSPSPAPPPPPIPLPTPPSQESLQHFKQSLQPPPPLPSHPAGSITIHVRLFHLPWFSRCVCFPSALSRPPHINTRNESILFLLKAGSNKS